MNTDIKSLPSFSQLIEPTFFALKELGGSGNNDEILNQIIEDLQLPNELTQIMHGDSLTKTELSYRAAWARTYLKKFGIIENSTRGVWSILPKYTNLDHINEAEVVSLVQGIRASKTDKETRIPLSSQPEDKDLTNDEVEYPDELKPWKDKLAEILQNMNPYAFERLVRRVLRESGFTEVIVTKASGDGGIDGTGVLKINGLLGFRVAFQCKRYKNSVGAPEIRDFRGSLPANIEKGIFVTTSTYTDAAIREAADQSKKQIDLVNGEELISKIIEYEIGVKPVTAYKIDESFFKNI